FLSKGKYTAFLRGGGATPAAFAQFTTAVRLQPASSAASVRLNPAATASTASSLVSNGYMRTPIRTPECPTFCPHPRLASLTTKSTIPTSKAITLSGAPATGYVKSMGYPSSYRDRTREKAMQNTPPKSKGQATKQS